MNASFCCRCKTVVKDMPNNIFAIYDTIEIRPSRDRQFVEKYSKFERHSFVFQKDIIKFEKYNIAELIAKYDWLIIDGFICDTCIEIMLRSVEIMAKGDERNGAVWPTPCVSCMKILDENTWNYSIENVCSYQKRYEFGKYIRPCRYSSETFGAYDEEEIEPEIFYDVINYDNSMKFLDYRLPYKEICYDCVRTLYKKGLILYTDFGIDSIRRAVQIGKEIEVFFCFSSSGIFGNTWDFDSIDIFRQYNRKCALIDEINTINNAEKMIIDYKSLH